MKDKYIITISLLSILLFISIILIIIGVSVINDLNSTVDMHINSRNVCRVEFKELQKEYEEYRKEILDTCHGGN